ncbi:hypothetical protein FSP39_009078 [Pinctada imbricata]|uniref:SOCS box domain-containing protein n=1 Tax=Pinctada imbricata TaxID=66713 RepID=A0AA89C170_PINIB|nr:hypothetical protein FSP39_009078 [Pinctada imbricata]
MEDDSNGENDVDTDEDSDIKSVIFKAIDYDDVALLTTVICDRKISPNFYKDETAPICKAAAHGNVAILAVLLHGNVILNVPDIKDHMWHRQPIHIAASKGHTHFVRVLIENGVHVDETDRDNRTALYWAAVFGQSDTARYLVSVGANVDAVQADGYTALHAAACFGYCDVCQVLLDGHADLQLTDKDGWNVCHSAASYGHLQVVQLVVNSGIDINTRTKANETMLHCAVSSGRLPVVQYLVQQGVTIDEKNSYGFTPFHLGIFYKRYEICRYLAEAGAKVQTTNHKGQTPCHHVAVRMDEEFLILLVKVGYNFSSESWIHENAFPITCVKTNEKVYSMLRYLAANCRSLKDLCCLEIRHLLGIDYKSKVHSLILPHLLKDMISFKDMSE